MKALVIGFGSIGQKHSLILKNLGLDVAILSNFNSIDYKSFDDLDDAINNFNPDYIMISNKTIDHYNYLLKLLKICNNKKILIEKPIFNKYEKVSENNNIIKVAYNLRFHPLIKKIKYIIESSKTKIFYMNVYVGSYLPNWRKNSDYRLSYSSKRIEGGGVLRDLSHELDYINLLTGKWITLSAFGGKFSNLEIDSDDVYKIIFETINCKSLSLELNYLDKNPKRYINLISEEYSIYADLINNKLILNGKEEFIEMELNQTYIDEHKNFLYENGNDLCSLHEGLEITKMIESIEISSRDKKWIRN